MSKQIIGKKYRREGKRGDRLFTVIQCQDCGAETYERKSSRIETALNAACRSCIRAASVKQTAELNETKKS